MPGNVSNPPSAAELIAQCAAIPSFSSYEERLHPWVRDFVSGLPGVTLSIIDERNLLLQTASTGTPAVALAAHLDKIDHFGDNPAALPVRVTDSQIVGQLDDAAGVGLCLRLLARSAAGELPPLLVLLSEMEESFGLREHPERLRGGGVGINHGQGAARLSRALIQRGQVPPLVITIDTTPLFRGTPGVALYSKHWEFNGLDPSPQLIQATDEVVARIQEIAPDIVLRNNTNDYLTYGRELNQGREHPTVCIALEPAIFPYHQKDEAVFLSDIQRVEAIVAELTTK